MLSVRNLHAYYGRAHILHGVSLEIGPGEVQIVVKIGEDEEGRTE